MKITSNQLGFIIKEELEKVLLSELKWDVTYEWELVDRHDTLYYLFGTKDDDRYVVKFAKGYVANEVSHEVSFGPIKSRGSMDDPDTFGLTGKNDFKVITTIVATIGDFVKNQVVPNDEQKIKLPPPEGEPRIKLGRKDQYKTIPAGAVLTFAPTSKSRTKLYLSLIKRSIKISGLSGLSIEKIETGDEDLGEESDYVVRIPIRK